MTTERRATAAGSSPGCFLLPAIDQGIPAAIGRDANRLRVLARFAEAARLEGIALPPGDFSTIEQVVAAQWVQFLGRLAPITSVLRGEPALYVTDTSLSLVIGATASLQAFRLKPVVEQLEAALPGLGWFVHGALQQANYHGHEQYEMGRSTYMLDCMHGELDQFTDDAYARSLLEQQGEDPPSGKLPEAVMQELRSSYSFWPSDFLAEVDGHEHLLGIYKAKQPVKLNSTAAKRWVKQNAAHPLAESVRLAIQLYRACEADSERSFVWMSGDDDEHPIGALCFVAWDEPGLLFEAISHWEQYQYEGGAAVEAFARHTLDLTPGINDHQLREFVRAAVDYFNRWELLAKLLSHFPVWEDDDET